MSKVMPEVASRRFAGRVAVVTGGAHGIGAACARRLAAEGASVVIADLDGTAAAKLAGDLPNAIAVTADVSESASWDRIACQADDAYGDIDILVSNAYTMVRAVPHELDEDGWDRTIDVNLKALYLGVRAFAPALQRTTGAIVAVSSVHSVRTMPGGFAAYAAAKGGVNAYVRALANEYSDLRVNAVLPGPIRTQQWDGTPAEEEAAEFERTALGRMGRPDEVAAAVVFLASDEASFVTGAILPVDGGWSIRQR